MLNSGDLIFIKGNVHLWIDAEADGGPYARFGMTNHYASIQHPHGENPDWYFVLLFEPFYSDKGKQVWTGWVYLPWGDFQKGYFEIIT